MERQHNTNKDEVEVSHATALVLPAFPGENPLRHEARAWLEAAEARMSAKGLMRVANGKVPMEVERIFDVDLASYPELPPEHRDYERRREKRAEAHTVNRRNIILRYEGTMKAWTQIYTAIKECTAKSAPMLSREILEVCNLSAHGATDGYFDGPRAWRIVVHRLAGEARTKSDKDYYRTAERLQREKVLSDTCSADDYSRKAMSYLVNIHPYLPYRCEIEDSAEYLLDLLPKGLKTMGRHLKFEIKCEGMLHDLMYVAKRCRELVAEEHKTTASQPALIVTDEDLQGYSLEALSETVGMALSYDKPAHTLGMISTEVKWCPDCPHRNGLQCFCDPAWRGVLPCSVYLNKDRLSNLKKLREKNARDKGVPYVEPQAPSKEKVELYKQALAKRKDKGKTKGSKGKAPAGQTKADVPGAPAISVDDFMAGLVDITSIAAGVAIPDHDGDDDSEEDLPELEEAEDDEDPAEALIYYVLVPTGHSTPEIQAVTNVHHLVYDPNTHMPVPFGHAEGEARAYHRRVMEEFLEATSEAVAAMGNSADGAQERAERMVDELERGESATNRLVAGGTLQAARSAAVGTPLGPTPLPVTATGAVGAPLPPLSTLVSYAGAKPLGAPVLDVDFPDNQIVKAHGARWDPARRCWWMQPGTDVVGLQAFLHASRRARRSNRTMAATLNAAGEEHGPTSTPTPLPQGIIAVGECEPTTPACLVTPQARPPAFDPPNEPVNEARASSAGEVVGGATPPTAPVDRSFGNIPLSLQQPRAQVYSPPTRMDRPASGRSSTRRRPKVEALLRQNELDRERQEGAARERQALRDQQQAGLLHTTSGLTLALILGLVALFALTGAGAPLDLAAVTGLAVTGGPVWSTAVRERLEDLERRAASAIQRAENLERMGGHIIILIIVVILARRTSGATHNVATKQGAEWGDSCCMGGVVLSAPRMDLLTREQASQLHCELLAGHEQPPDVPEALRNVLCIIDTGCGRSMGTHRDHFAPGTLVPQKARITGAGGAFETQESGHLRFPIETVNHGVMAFTEKNAIFNPACAYVLLSIGRASIEEGVQMHMPRWGESGTFDYPNGVTVRFLNRNVTVLRPLGYKGSPPASLAAVLAEDLGVPPEGQYVIYLGSGPRRTEDLGTILGDMRADLTLLMIDIKIGGKTHDITRRPVAAALAQAARAPRCAGVLASISCTTWSVAGLIPHPKARKDGPYRDSEHVLGIPRADGTLPSAVVLANLEAEHAAEICLAALTHGGFVLAEQPARRRPGTEAYPGLALDDCGRAAHLFDHPAWQQVIAVGRAKEITWDQCTMADDPHLSPRKSTVWLATAPILYSVNAYFSHRLCDHPPRTHARLAGTDDTGQWVTVTSGSETYSTGTNRLIARCISEASTVLHHPAAVAGVIQGKSLAKHAVTHEHLHQSFNHVEARILRHLPDALCDAPEWWRDAVEDKACDACLRANASKIGGGGGLPQVEGLAFMDIMHVNVPELFTGYKLVLGVTHAATGFRKTIRMEHKSQAPEALRIILAYFHSVSRPITWIHTDGAHELKGTGVIDCAERSRIRVTTTLASSSHQNPQEAQWRVYGMQVRSNLAQARLPYEFWGWALDHAEDGAALTPSKAPPHDCPLGRILSEKPAGAYRRPFGCLCYVSVAERYPNGTLVNKLGEQGVRAIHLGYGGGRSGSFEGLSAQRAQPGYYCYVPSFKGRGRVVVSASVRFITPAVFPGLQRTAGGVWKIPYDDAADEATEEPELAELDTLYELRQESDIPDVKAAADTLSIARGLPPEDQEEQHATADPVKEAEGTPPVTEPAETEPTPEDAQGEDDGGGQASEGKYLAPAELWPDEMCTEHGGKGWEVTELRRKGKFSRVRFAQPDANGNEFENQWVRTSELLPVPPEPPTPPESPTPAQEGEEWGPTPNWNTIPAEPGGDPLREPKRPERNRKAVERYLSGLYALVGLDDGGALAREHGFDAKSPRMPLSALKVHLTKRGTGGNKYAERSAALAEDYLTAAGEHGLSAPETTMVRELHAASRLDAALAGVQVPPLDPLFAAIHEPQLRIRGGDMFNQEYHGGIYYSLSGGAFAAKGKSSPDDYTEQQMRGPEWDTPKQLEIAKIADLNARTEVAADDPAIAGMKVCETMWTGRRKRDADGSTKKLNARCVCRGDLQKRFYQLTSNDTFSPTVRNTSLLCIEALAVKRGMFVRKFDVPGAYLQGKQTAKEQMVLRPPVGFRKYDERGVEILWLMNSPLYGQGDAGAIWNRTINDFLEGDLKLKRSTYDPCVYSGAGGDVILPLYVDDGRIYYTAQGRSQATLIAEGLASRFQVECGPESPGEDYFLGGNRWSNAERTTVTISATSHIDAMLKRYADGDISIKKYPAAWGETPADDTLQREWERAVAARPAASKELINRYGSLFGALLYTIRYRPDIAACMSLLGSCLTFPTEALYECAMRVLVYLGRTRSTGISFSRHQAGDLVCYADSNWTVTRSTSGYCMIFSGGSIAAGSHRQHCITMSSTEAELVALADLAIEMISVTGLYSDVGVEFAEPIVVCTDNKGAYDLCHRYTSAQNSRHIDRKLFKMRELRGAGVVVVKHVLTDQNPADMFTKILPRAVFQRHRKFVLNTAADPRGGEYAEA